MARQLMGIYSLPVWGLIDCVGKGKLLFFIYTYVHVHIHQSMSQISLPYNCILKIKNFFYYVIYFFKDSL